MSSFEEQEALRYLNYCESDLKNDSTLIYATEVTTKKPWESKSKLETSSLNSQYIKYILTNKFKELYTKKSFKDLLAEFITDDKIVIEENAEYYMNMEAHKKYNKTTIYNNEEIQNKCRLFLYLNEIKIGENEIYFCSLLLFIVNSNELILNKNLFCELLTRNMKHRDYHYSSITNGSYAVTLDKFCKSIEKQHLGFDMSSHITTEMIENNPIFNTKMFSYQLDTLNYILKTNDISIKGLTTNRITKLNDEGMVYNSTSGIFEAFENLSSVKINGFVYADMPGSGKHSLCLL